MKNIKNVARFSKKFVADHKVAIAVVSTALVCGKLNRMAQRDQVDFIKSHDLWDEFITPAA